MAYRIALPLSLAGVHNVFHVSQLKMSLTEADPVIDMRQPEIRLNLTLLEKPKRILERKEKVLRNKIIKYVKVLWNNQTKEAPTSWKTQ